MPLIKLFRLLLACAIALAALSAHARQAEALHAQNMPLEKIQWLYIDCPRVWLAQAVDSHQENAYVYGEGVSEPTHYNYFRTYQPAQGIYTQADPIGLDGGLNRFGYVDASPLSMTDPFGLQAMPGGLSPRGIPPNLNPQNRLPSGAPAPMANQVIGGATDFMRNYNDMRNANTIGADKYFHCRANCQASRRGSAGESVACKLSDGREWFDQAIKGDPASASAADQAANTFGRSHAGTSGSCDVVCSIYRPNGLSPRY